MREVPPPPIRTATGNGNGTFYDNGGSTVVGGGFNDANYRVGNWVL